MIRMAMRRQPPRAKCPTALPLAAGLLAALAAAAAQAAPPLEQLRNLSFGGIYDKPVTLTDGVYEGEPFVPGGASRPRVQLIEDLIVSADLAGDRSEDNAVLLAESSGGSGQNVYLAVVESKEDDDLDNVATRLIGDRVQIRSMTASEGKLVLDLVVAGPEDPACCPALKVRSTYEVDESALAERSREEQGRLSAADLSGTRWSLSHFAWDEPVTDDISISAEFEGDQVSGQSGCNRYFAGIRGADPYDIAIGPAGATRKACPEPQMEAEARYLLALQEVKQFGFLNGRLVLTYQAEGAGIPRTMIFTRED